MPLLNQALNLYPNLLIFNDKSLLAALFLRVNHGIRIKIDMVTTFLICSRSPRGSSLGIIPSCTIQHPFTSFSTYFFVPLFFSLRHSALLIHISYSTLWTLRLNFAQDNINLNILPCQMIFFLPTMMDCIPNCYCLLNPIWQTFIEIVPLNSIQLLSKCNCIYFRYSPFTVMYLRQSRHTDSKTFRLGLIREGFDTRLIAWAQ